ncbi:MAG TPA: TonB-dependent receptor [Steroidobacteraceae bacterium]|nr:TonB-dependent receptor [Steroidobacteraceae bacterium]
MKNGVRVAIAATVAACSSGAYAQEQENNNAPIEEVVVIGSRIPRVQQEGPAPITVLDSREIESSGLTSVPDVLKALTQNGGETQSQQSFNGADFTPGAEQVDLRGLGANHTLVLVNGRRIADFPLPFNGLSNFTDISNIPVGMIDKVEVLSGSASAIYGSDAIAGVVNFVLKKDVEGVDFSYRYGTPTADGGGDSHRLSVSTGISREKFHAVFGLELLDKRPLWAFDRKIQDSTADNPTTDAPLARRDFLRIEPNDDVYIDPGQATCASLASYSKGTTYWATRPGWGPFDEDLDDWGDGHFCGSNESIGWGTILSERRGATGFASLTYELSDSTSLFADVLVGVSKVKLMNDVLSWQFQDENGSEDGIFFNDQVGDLDSWYRQFTPEEMGGLERGMIHSDQKTITVTPGIKGKLGDKWNYEAYLNHSQYELKVDWPQVVASAANDLFLGESTGFDDDSGYATFDADPARLYTPLTPDEFDSITARTTYHPQSRNDYASFTLTNGDLFSLPGGNAGFAANVEAGNQSYELKPDPLALGYYYYGWKDQDGHGSRNHWSGSYEFRLPVVRMLELSTAGRYDSYHFAGHDVGKFTYNFGLEFRPLDTLLVRGYYGTGFRAPDLHYVFAGEGNVHPSANDYYLCRTEEPDEDIDDCSFSDVGIVSTRSGNRELKPETSTSWGAGFVWSPVENLMVSVDYFDVKLEDQVVDIDIDKLLRAEADCRIGSDADGDAVAVNSPTCADAIARVERYPLSNPVSPGELFGVRVNPINIAHESTDGVDFGLRYKQPIADSSLTFNLSYTKVFDHESQQYPGDPVIDMFRPDSGFDIPRSKASASLTFDHGPFSATLHAQRLDRLPNWDEDGYIPASILMNASVEYEIAETVSARITVDNLADKKPVKDATYASYPYYDISWFDSVGRTVYFTVNYKFGQ